MRRGGGRCAQSGWNPPSTLATAGEPPVDEREVVCEASPEGEDEASAGKAEESE
jgi:hypothetical protein